MWFAIWIVCRSIFREVVFRIRSLYEDCWWTTFFSEKVLPKKNKKQKKSAVKNTVGLDVNYIKAMVYFKIFFWLYGSVQFSAVLSDSLWPHESQHARPPCPSPTPRVYANSCPPSQWCHPAISSSVAPLFSCPQSLPASESFQWVNSSHEVAKVLEFQLQHQSFQRNPRADLLQNGLVESLCSPRDSQESSPTTVQKHQLFSAQPSSQSNSHIHTWPQEKP